MELFIRRSTVTIHIFSGCISPFPLLGTASITTHAICTHPSTAPLAHTPMQMRHRTVRCVSRGLCAPKREHREGDRIDEHRLEGGLHVEHADVGRVSRVDGGEDGDADADVVRHGAEQREEAAERVGTPRRVALTRDQLGQPAAERDNQQLCEQHAAHCRRHLRCIHERRDRAEEERRQREREDKLRDHLLCAAREEAAAFCRVTHQHHEHDH
eukprot:5276301-Pleurochrysis_carterae.AAC.2